MLVNTGGLRVRGDGGVDELVPHLGDFRLAAALFEPKSFHQAGHHAGGGLGAVGAGAFLLSKINSAPLGQNTPSCPSGSMRAHRLGAVAFHQHA